MPNYILDGHDLSDLFDTRRPSFSFKDNPRHIIPNKGSILYSVWDGDEQFIYIGISGLQKSMNRRNPISRMQSHASGRRSGDQFFIYIHDNLRYRFVSFLSDDSDGIVRRLENKIKKGDMGFTPKINGIDV